MTYNIIVQPPAISDAVEYARFIRLASQDEETSARWLNELEVLIQSLSEMPRRFRVIDEQLHFSIELRQVMHYSHRVIFHVNDERAEVHVLRVYHGRRDALQPDDV